MNTSPSLSRKTTKPMNTKLLLYVCNFCIIPYPYRLTLSVSLAGEGVVTFFEDIVLLRIDDNICEKDEEKYMKMIP